MTIGEPVSDQDCEVFGIILAAGSGRRMKAGRNKVWLELKGKCLVERSIDSFRASGRFHHLVLVGNPDEWDDFSAFLESRPYRQEISLVAGGEERQDSVANALRYLEERFGGTEEQPESSAQDRPRRLVAIHDAARPLITVALLSRGIEAAREYHAVGLAVPVKDTIKQVDAAQMVLDTPDRSRLWAMQTPQIFDFQLIVSCYRRIAGSGLIFSDDCAVVEHAGLPVKLVPSSYYNLKITTPEDLRIAESFLDQMAERGEAQ